MKKHKGLSFLTPKAILLLGCLFLVGCNSGSDSELSPVQDDSPTVAIPITDEEAAAQLEEAFANIGHLANIVDSPPRPDADVDVRTILGVDSNNNGTRDLIERVSYQGLNMIDGVNISIYDQVVAVMNMIQPQDPPVPNSINNVDINCAYMALPEGVKTEVSLELMKAVVLDTQARRTAYRASIEPSSASLGAEQCE